MEETEERNEISRQLHFIGIVLVLIFIVLAFFGIQKGLELYQSYNESKQLEELSYQEMANRFNQEIEAAKNTTYMDGIVSILINNIDQNATWDYFISDNGKDVVEVNGKFNKNNMEQVLSILTDNIGISPYETGVGTIITTTPNGNKSFDTSKIDSITFRIQFVKHLDDSLKDNVYDKYYQNYAEIVIAPYSGLNITRTASTSIFNIMNSYIRNVLWTN